MGLCSFCRSYWLLTASWKGQRASTTAENKSWVKSSWGFTMKKYTKKDCLFAKYGCSLEGPPCPQDQIRSQFFFHEAVPRLLNWVHLHDRDFYSSIWRSSLKQRLSLHDFQETKRKKKHSLFLTLEQELLFFPKMSLLCSWFLEDTNSIKIWVFPIKTKHARACGRSTRPRQIDED